MCLAVKAVAQAPARCLTWNRNRPHDLADVREAAEEMPATPCPRTEVVRIGMELVRPGIEFCAHRPGWRRLGRDYVEKVYPEWRPGYRFATAFTADRRVLVEESGYGDAIDLPASEPTRHASRL